MKLRLIAALAMLFCASGTLFGQDLAGTWQGTLTPPGGGGGRGGGAPSLRIVFKITKGDDGKFAGQLFSIDQGAQPIPMNAITVDGRTVKFKIDAISGIYEGTFGPDGNAINGTFTQGMPAPLNLSRATPATAWAIPEPPPPPKPMDPAADPGIEVATVKLSPVETRGRGVGFQGTQLTVTTTACSTRSLLLTNSTNCRFLEARPGCLRTGSRS